MTEDEAKTKWCPFSRVLGSGPLPVGEGSAFGSVNRAEKPLSTFCIASACMAWRTRQNYRETETVSGHQRPVGDGWEPNVGQSGWHRSFYDPDGFCGLAGQP